MCPLSSSSSQIRLHRCHSLQIYHGILLVVAQGGSALLMIMRTYALYNCNRKVAILLVTILVIGAGISTWAINSTVSMDRNGAQSAYTVSLTTTDTCMLLTSQSEGKRYALAWGVILIFDVTVFALTVARSIGNAIAWQYGLFYLILRDGSMYFGILIVCYLTNVLTFVFAEPGYRGYLATLTNVLSSTLINRMMLNVRNHIRPSLPLSHMSQDYELQDVPGGPLDRSI
ncbi:hypothetical protein C8Q80DRAFT_919161 [Daedaleopsis nitida]|nr:hypothetical protein C8Q80DRAFT_919161 [Daedaleopsis nitida]